MAMSIMHRGTGVALSLGLCSSGCRGVQSCGCCRPFPPLGSPVVVLPSAPGFLPFYPPLWCCSSSAKRCFKPWMPSQHCLHGEVLLSSTPPPMRGRTALLCCPSVPSHTAPTPPGPAGGQRWHQAQLCGSSIEQHLSFLRAGGGRAGIRRGKIPPCDGATQPESVKGRFICTVLPWQPGWGLLWQLGGAAGGAGGAPAGGRRGKGLKNTHSIELSAPHCESEQPGLLQDVRFHLWDWRGVCGSQSCCCTSCCRIKEPMGGEGIDFQAAGAQGGGRNVFVEKRGKSSAPLQQRLQSGEASCAPHKGEEMSAAISCH